MAAIEDPSPLIREGLGAVEAILDDVGSSAPETLAGPVGHALDGRGKRFRPLVTLLTFRACRGPTRARVDAHRSAAAVELVHTATLLVDDVFDEAGRRRGRPSVDARFGQRPAVLAAGVLAARAFDLAAPRSGREVLDAYDDVEAALDGFERLLEGEARGMQEPQERTVDAWIEIAAGKTGALFELAADLGARRAGAHGILEPLRTFGRRFGVAFQAADDVLDVAGDPQRTGKPVGQDAADRAPNAARWFGVERARELAHDHADAAIQRLGVLPETQYRETLAELAWSAARREV